MGTARFIRSTMVVEVGFVLIFGNEEERIRKSIRTPKVNIFFGECSSCI